MHRGSARGPWPGRPPAGTDDAVPPDGSDLHDLDEQPDERDDPPRAARGPGWRTGAAVLAAAVLAATTTAVVTAAHVRAADRARQDAATAALALQVGAVSVLDPDGPVAGGHLRLQVSVPLANRGPRAVSATVLGLTTAHQRTAAVPGAVRVAPGTASPVPFLLDVDCAAVPEPVAGYAVGDDPASVLVRLAGAGVRHLRLLPEDSRAVTVGLIDSCHPDPADTVTTAWAYPDDGHAVVTVTNTGAAGTAPVRLDLLTTAGVGAASTPTLPLSLPAGATTRVDLSTDPDCGVVADGTGSQLDLAVVGGEEGFVLADLSTGVTDPFSGQPVGTGRWLVRQIALHCG